MAAKKEHAGRNKNHPAASSGAQNNSNQTLEVYAMSYISADRSVSAPRSNGFARESRTQDARKGLARRRG